MAKKSHKSQKSKNGQIPSVENPIRKKDAHSQPKSKSASVVNPLEGARFRWLNESLYTESSVTSFDLFQRDPALFTAYHNGFRSQTLSWPVSPVQECCAFIRATLVPGSVIGDFGCGDADIAKTIGDVMKVHSFDLVSTNPLVTACKIAHVPLENNSLDMAVFSLSLMGTDWPSFIAEAANRCLKIGGILYIAEVQSRVVDFDAFKKLFASKFDVLRAENVKEKYFVKLILKKRGNIPQILDANLLKPCMYKRR